MATYTDILKADAENAYRVTRNLMEMVDADKLGWKPATGSNWMTLGQLLMHLTSACGTGIRGFVTGDWGMPEGMKMQDLAPEDMLPPAEKMPAVSSVKEALALLEKDRHMALDYIQGASDRDLLQKMVAAPWGGPPMPLGQHMGHMIGHLAQHKGQLFYYLKLLGKPVDTSTLWGM